MIQTFSHDTSLQLNLGSEHNMLYTLFFSTRSWKWTVESGSYNHLLGLWFVVPGHQQREEPPSPEDKTLSTRPPTAPKDVLYDRFTIIFLLFLCVVYKMLCVQLSSLIILCCNIWLQVSTLNNFRTLFLAIKISALLYSKMMGVEAGGDYYRCTDSDICAERK